MQLNPESLAIVDKLNNDQSVKATSTTIGPFNQISKDVLSLIIDNYDLLNNKSGDDRVTAFITAYKKLLEKRKEIVGVQKEDIAEDSGESLQPETTEYGQWYIHDIECHSIRGIDSYGETFSFSFEGKSNLIYGPNGSGKSSLLGAVIWGFTGIAITDASDDKQETDVHQKTNGTKKGKKIRPNAWPVISTLPETDIESITPDSWVLIELKSKEQANTLYVKRTLSGLEAGLDKDKLEPCKNLDGYGIKPLDLQISLIAPTILSRNTLENADDIIKILSMILGFDVLDDIGGLAKNIGTNRTTYANGIQRNIDNTWKTVHEKLAILVDPLNEKSPVRAKIQDITSRIKPTLTELTEKQTLIQEEIDEANKNVAEVLGIDPEDKDAREGLADKLIEAIVYLEKGFAEVFPSFSEIKYIPEQHGDRSITTIEQELSVFCEKARTRIQQRINWWKREKTEGSKLTLKLRASSEYDVDKMECPVCDQSVENLPIKSEMEKLKTLDEELQRALKDFFNDLLDELERIVSKEIRKISQSFPFERISTDWQKINTSFDERLKTVSGKYNPQVQKIQKSLEDIPVIALTFFDETDEDLLNASKTFMKACNDSINSIKILKWSDKHFENIKTRLLTLIISSEPASLLSELSKSKEKASDIKPLNTIKTQLDEIIKLRKAIIVSEAEFSLLASLRPAIDEIKKFIKYAQEKTEEIFNQIKVVSDDNWKLLYDESPTGLISSKFVLERGKTIEPFLSKNNYEVQGKYFANAGLQRAIALCFLCALIENNNGGISFTLFDDPILSLDEEHRERWVRRIVSSTMKKKQVILATHQELFLTNCYQDFIDELTIKLNPRTRKKRLSVEPGYLIERACYWLDYNWEYANDLLYQYVEYLLETLDSYSPDAFYNKDRLKDSFEAYKKLPDGNPLNSKKKNTIINVLTECFVENVFRKRHLSTSHEVTGPMTKDAYQKLKKLDEDAFRVELARLKRLRAKELKDNVIKGDVDKTVTNLTITFNKRSQIPVIGRAAARPETWIVEESEQASESAIENFACVHVTGNTFDPVARCGQCILLSGLDDVPEEGDLVVGETSEHEKFLRRISFNDESAFLYSINPLKITAPLQIDRNDLSVHRVIGVLYEPCRHCSAENLNGNEWHPCENIDPSYFENMKMIAVEGNSLEPIARKGQNVLVKEGVMPQGGAIETGGLAVIETNDESIGNEIKRVYPNVDSWTFVSPNPLEAYAPHVVPVENIKKVWPLKGVIFESNLEE